MKGCLGQLRDMPKEVNPDNAICKTLGKACRDPRARCGEAVGPFGNYAREFELDSRSWEMGSGLCATRDVRIHGS